MSITFALLAATSLRASNTAPPPISREFRGVWVATVDNIDWPSRRNLSSEQQKAEMVALLDKAQRLHLNAVIFQVRPSGDALYPSRIEPWSEYLTGLQGSPPRPLWDPLEFAVVEAHKRGLELHCWFNPYRALHPAQKGPLAPNHIGRTNPTLVKKYGPYQWMDPGERLVQDRMVQVISDVVRRYDVDGVHIDDYFYPYREKDKAGQYIPFPDDSSWTSYQRSGGILARDDWRRSNVDQLIERLYKTIKREKRWVKFGISPFGIFRPGVPAGIKANVDQYADLYADALKWLRNGWCDYFTPQLYWPMTQTPQAFPVLLQWWAGNNPAGRSVWPGLYTSRMFEGPKLWKASEIVNQVELAKRMPGAGGAVHFSMKAFMHDSGGIDEALLSGPYAGPAFVPSSPWLGGKPPEAPNVSGSAQGIHWTSSCEQFAISFFVNGSWRPWQKSSLHDSFVPARAEACAVVGFDRAEQESIPRVVQLGGRSDR